MLTQDRLSAALKILFPIAMVAAFAAAISPLAVPTGPDGGDKFLHMLAFYGLTLFGAAAYPRLNPIVLLVAMSLYGGAIELVQGQVGRDADIADWIADTAAAAAALAPFNIALWRARRR